MWGKRKHKTKLAKWLFEQGLEQQDLVKASKVSRSTISKACNEREYIPSPGVMKLLIKAIRKHDPEVNINDFWSL
ncbi:helix-turn-helix domain-containing protein [Bacillus gaemokensis]|uniref:XRE family transcriptional regulator n=1 Tax=Bacillus gaemokensis TaxID=574375 RepID=A0A073K6Q3_9BACI|nr:helix-turn-helix transcriptional regulator [Bacillus gaemokensis]KEK22157.1 XRE family transcriptional regulator [Bacillus gaemokensis]KYG35593.1 XRE family transcriptional regulator [Bacillus gaemokensis]